MSEFNISIPISGFATTSETWAKAFSGVTQGLEVLKANTRVYNAVIECSKNSNVPKELLFSMILALSNSKNNSAYKSADMKGRILDPLVRAGYFALSNMTARICLANEISQGRINTAERSYLNKYGNIHVQNYIIEKPTSESNKTIAKWWRIADGSNIQKINDANCLKFAPFNFESPELSICIGAIILGQCWDYYAKYLSKPLVPVVSSLLLPYDYHYFADGRSYPFNTEIIRPPLNVITDWDNMKAIDKLPKPNIKQPFSASSNGNVINPNGNWIGLYVPLVAGKGGALELLV